ncbi:MAG: glucokinase [Steroidobacteraceae bacterium]
MILTGDIGGTHTRLALFERGERRSEPEVEEVFSSAEHASLEEILQIFAENNGQKIERACFGVAGPVRDGVAQLSNLSWNVDALRLAAQLKVANVELVNDLEALAHGLAVLEEVDLVILNQGDPGRGGNKALIAAGTGLGEAGLHWEEEYYQPFATEGGHVDFAPTNPLEIELLSYLFTQYEHVSYERVLSGPGLHNILTFLVKTGRGEEPAWLQHLQGKDPGALITQAALEGSSAPCVEALRIFVGIYGSEAANLALKVMATGGVYVGGGIAPRIIKQLQGAAFMQSFLAKARMATLLEAVPVRVIMNDRTALYGAARIARFGVRLGQHAANGK